MTTPTDTLIQHTEDILGVARRLLSQEVMVYSQECSSVHFGAWSVVAGVERERFRFCWDGRTITLTIFQGVLVEGRRNWQPLHSLNFRHPEAVSAMETFLYEHFTPGAEPCPATPRPSSRAERLEEPPSQA